MGAFLSKILLVSFLVCFWFFSLLNWQKNIFSNLNSFSQFEKAYFFEKTSFSLIWTIALIINKFLQKVFLQSSSWFPPALQFVVAWYSNTLSWNTSWSTWRIFPSWAWNCSNTQSAPGDGTANTNRSKWDWQENCTCCRLSLGKMPNTREKYLISTRYKSQPVLQ